MSEGKDRYDRGFVEGEGMGRGIGITRGRTDYTIGNVIGAIQTIQKLTDITSTIDKIMSLFSSKGVDMSKMNFSNTSSIMKMLLSMKKTEDEEGTRDEIDDLIETLHAHDEIKLSDIEEATTVINKYLRVTGSAKSLIKRVGQKATVGSEEMGILQGMLGIKEKKVVEEVEEEPVELTTDEREEMRNIIAERKEREG